MKILAIPVLALAMLAAGCSKPPETSSDAQKRIALCEEVMKSYIREAKTYERDRKRLIGSCRISQRERTVEQWRCVLAAMKKGEPYVEASDRCGRVLADAAGEKS